MKRTIGVFLILTTPLLLSAGDDDAKKVLKALEGKWTTAEVEAGGKVFPKGTFDFTMVIGADGKSTGKMPTGEFQFTITVDPKKKPRTMDNLHETGADKGKKQYGIYKLEGDKLTVCMTPRGAPESDRPTEFTSKGSKSVVFVFERIKEEKK